MGSIKRNTTFKLLLLLLLGGNSAFAQLTVAEIEWSSVIGAGARAWGMGGAFVAVADDGTTASWNPAGLSQLNRPEITVMFSRTSINVDEPGFNIDDVGGPIVVSDQKLANTANTLDFLSLAIPLNLGGLHVTPQVNYQRAIQTGFQGEFREAFTLTQTTVVGGNPAEITATGELDQDLSGGFDLISSSVGVQLNPKVNLGFGVNVWRGGQSGDRNFTVTASIDPMNFPDVVQENRFSVEEDVSGVNFNIGALFKPVEKVGIGVVYKTPFSLNYSSKEISGLLQDGTEIDSEDFFAEATLEFPYAFGAGILLQPSDQLTFAADFTYTNWSEAKLTDVSGTLDGIEFELDESFNFPGNGFDPNTGEARAQVNTQQIRFGLEYVFLMEQMILPFRGGVFFNTPYFTDFNDKKITNVGFSFGSGVGIGGLFLDAAFVYQGGSFAIDETRDRDTATSRIFLSAIYRFNIKSN